MDISIPMQTRMKEDSSMIDLSLDYHAHILPGCDHGSSSVDMSLKQINMAKEAGVQTICVTPHFYPHKESVSSFIERRRQTADILWAQIPTNAPRVLLGAEVLICDGMERLKAIHELCLEGTNELLLEMPFYRWPAPIWDTLYRLNDLRDRDRSCGSIPAGGYPSIDFRRDPVTAECGVSSKTFASKMLP